VRAAAALVAIVGLALALFGWWGMYTAAGRHRYDEMDGLIPFFAGCVGLVLLAVALLVATIRRWKSARRAG
jgi:hypothetical protein